MPGALGSIEGMQAKHVAILADELDIRTPGDLARVDRRVIHAAMRQLRPWPELEEISRWQDAARDIATASADPDWEQAAAFVISFETRSTEAGSQQRVVAEQAERTPPPRQVWSGWACEPVGAWLEEQAGAQATAADDEAAEVDEAPPPGGLAPGPAADGGPAGPQRPSSGAAGSSGDSPAGRTTAAGSPPRPTVTLEEATLLTAGGPAVDLVSAEEAVVGPHARLRVTVSGGFPCGGVSVALRLRRPGRPSSVPHDPVVARSGVPVEIELDRVPRGAFAAVLALWAPDGAVEPSVVPVARFHRADPR